MALSLTFLSPLLILSSSHPEMMKNAELYVPSLALKDHLIIFVKSVIMSTSWVMAFYAIKHLPITIVTPIRMTSPFFTLLGALVLYHERPTPLQWLGFTLIIFSMYLYSRVGKKEGLDFKRNKWIYAIFAATFLSACSGLYDKFLLQNCQYNSQTVLIWFTAYVVLILGIVLAVTYFSSRFEKTKFTWRWSIPLIGIFIVLSDFFYYRALQDKEALITLLSAIMRSQVVIVVVVGGWIFKEKNKRKKIIPLIGVVCGVALILYSV